MRSIVNSRYNFSGGLTVERIVVSCECCDCLSLYPFYSSANVIKSTIFLYCLLGSRKIFSFRILDRRHFSPAHLATFPKIPSTYGLTGTSKIQRIRLQVFPLHQNYHNCSKELRSTQQPQWLQSLPSALEARYTSLAISEPPRYPH